MLAFFLCGGFFACERGKRMAVRPDEHPVVAVETSMGIIKIELYPDKAPVTVNNFLEYVESRFYDGTIFHRVIPDFMIQGGGFQPGLVEKSANSPIKNEAGNGLKNEEGTIAMARTNEVNSATAQFFINVKNNAFLNHQDETPRGYGYAVFGKVIEGLDVVHQIEHVKTGTVGMYENVPVEPVAIKSVRRER